MITFFFLSIDRPVIHVCLLCKILVFKLVLRVTSAPVQSYGTCIGQLRALRSCTCIEIFFALEESNQSINQSINQLINQSIIHSFIQSISLLNLALLVKFHKKSNRRTLTHTEELSGTGSGAFQEELSVKDTCCSSISDIWLPACFPE
jgi:hypothetical protein